MQLTLPTTRLEKQGWRGAAVELGEGEVVQGGKVTVDGERAVCDDAGGGGVVVEGMKLTEEGVEGGLREGCW